MLGSTRAVGVCVVVLALLALAPRTVRPGELSQPRYAVLEERDVEVPMRDGARLSTDVYRPDATERFPVILVRTPYDKRDPGTLAYVSPGSFVPRGYAVVVQDTRGRYASEGTFDAFQSEGPDGYDALEWVGAQPWCSGSIAMDGESYVGFTQWMPAALHSPYLKALMPGLTFGGVYGAVYRGGCFELRSWTAWSHWMTCPSGYDFAPLWARLDTVTRQLPLAEQDRAMGCRASCLHTWLAHPERDAYWDRSSIRDKYARVTASAYHCGGWFDAFLNGTLDGYAAMASPEVDPQVRAPQKLRIRQWAHMSRGLVVGQVDFGAAAAFGNTDTLRLRWFDSQLKGLDTGIIAEPPVQLFAMGTNVWSFEHEWPLARATYAPY